MTDAQDTIDLPVFGLTLTRGYLGRYCIDGATAYLHMGGPFAVASVRRANGVRVSYSVHADDDDPCAALLAEMTPDDVAAIRALGER